MRGKNIKANSLDELKRMPPSALTSVNCSQGWRVQDTFHQKRHTVCRPAGDSGFIQEAETRVQSRISEQYCHSFKASPDFWGFCETFPTAVSLPPDGLVRGWGLGSHPCPSYRKRQNSLPRMAWPEQVLGPKELGSEVPCILSYPMMLNISPPTAPHPREDSRCHRQTEQAFPFPTRACYMTSGSFPLFYLFGREDWPAQPDPRPKNILQIR